MTDSQKPSIRPGLQKRLLFAFILVTLFFILIFIIILPYRFYERDVNEARFKATEISELVKVGLISTMISTGDSKRIRDLIKRYQSISSFEFRLIRSQFVEKQHGAKENFQDKDELIQEVLKTGKRRQEWITGTKLRYAFPFIADERCEECHIGMDGNKIEIGSVLGASEIIFELKGKKYDSIRFIIEVMVMLVTCLITLGLVLFYIVKKGILNPLKDEN